MKDLVRAVKASVLTEPPQSWPTFDGATLSRANYLTASEAHRCIRELACDKMLMQNAEPGETEVTEEMLDNPNLPNGIFERGHEIEAWMVKRLHSVLDSNCERLVLTGKDQVSFYNDKARVSGTPDGIYSLIGDENEFTLMEFKSTAYPVYAVKPAHVTQVLVNMGLIRYVAKEVGGQKLCRLLGWDEADYLDDKGNLLMWTGGRIAYVNSSNYFDIVTFDVEYDNGKTFVETVKKARALFDDEGMLKKHPKEYPAEGLETGGCHFCKHKAACKTWLEEDDDPRFVKLTPPKPPKPLNPLPKSKDNAAFREAVGDYLSAKVKAAEFSAVADKLDKEQVRPWMVENEQQFTFTDEESDITYKFSLSEQTRVTFDKKAAAADGVQVSKYEKESKPFTVLRVTEAKGNDDD